MCWSFCIRSFCTFGSWHACTVSHPPSHGGFLTVSCLLWVCQEAVSKCAGILVTEIGHHQNLSPVASSGASTPKQFCSFSLHLRLKIFNAVFYRCRQFLPPVITQTWIRAVEVKMKVHLKLRSWAKMFFQECKEQPFVWTCFEPIILTSPLFWFLGPSFRCRICPLKGVSESSSGEPRSQPCQLSDWQNQRWPSDLLLRHDVLQCLTSANPKGILPMIVNKISLESYCPYFPFAADIPAEVFLVTFHICHKTKIKYF